MGKSLELLGMAAFNVVLAMILFSAFIKDAAPPLSVSQLTEANVTSFIEDVSAISGGMKEDMDSFAITTFLMDHISDDSRFSTILKYRIDDGEDEEQMDMGKMDFISYVLKGQETMDRHESRVDIDYIKITGGGRSAHVVTTTRERGMIMAFNDFGDESTVPVVGTSYCEQELVLSDKKMIQMKEADCTTYMEISDGY